MNKKLLMHDFYGNPLYLGTYYYGVDNQDLKIVKTFGQEHHTREEIQESYTFFLNLEDAKDYVDSGGVTLEF